jgi:hypothetical protein
MKVLTRNASDNTKFARISSIGVLSPQTSLGVGRRKLCDCAGKRLCGGRYDFGVNSLFPVPLTKENDATKDPSVAKQEHSHERPGISRW